MGFSWFVLQPAKLCVENLILSDLSVAVDMFEHGIHHQLNHIIM